MPRCTLKCVPPTSNSTIPKPKSVRQKNEKTNIVSKEEIQNALLTLDSAKQQNTWKSLEEPFYK